MAQARVLRAGMLAVAVGATLVLTTSAAAAAEPLGASPGTRHPAPRADVPPIVRVDSSGVTYELPSGTDVTLTRTGPQFAFPSGAIHFVSRGNVSAPDGTTYTMSVSATRFLGSNQGGTDLFLLLQRDTSGPSGAAAQFHGYDFSLPKSALQYSQDEPSALISSGTGLGDFGSVKLAFAPEGSPTPSCNGENERWHGSSSGSVSFTPQGDNGFFGTLTRSSFNAALDVEHGCLGFPEATPHGKVPPCPEPTFDVDGIGGTQTNSTEVFAMPDPDPGLADQFATAEIALDPAIVIHEVDAVVPRGGVTQGPKRTATITTYPGTFLSGSADYRSKGPAVVDGPYPCRTGKVVFKSTFGPLTGSPGDPFTAEFDTGAVVVPPDQRDALLGEYDRQLVK